MKQLISKFDLVLLFILELTVVFFPALMVVPALGEKKDIVAVEGYVTRLLTYGALLLIIYFLVKISANIFKDSDNKNTIFREDLSKVSRGVFSGILLILAISFYLIVEASVGKWFVIGSYYYIFYVLLTVTVLIEGAFRRERYKLAITLLILESFLIPFAGFTTLSGEITWITVVLSLGIGLPRAASRIVLAYNRRLDFIGLKNISQKVEDSKKKKKNQVKKKNKGKAKKTSNSTANLDNKNEILANNFEQELPTSNLTFFLGVGFLALSSSFIGCLATTPILPKVYYLAYLGLITVHFPASSKAKNALIPARFAHLIIISATFINLCTVGASVWVYLSVQN